MGSNVISAERIDPSKLSADDEKQLSKALYEVHRQIFAGLDAQELDEYVLNSPADETRVLLYRNSQQELVGYFGVHRFDTRLDGRPTAVFRAEAGLLPGYRQRDGSPFLLLRQTTLFRILHPRTRVYFLCAPVNPSSYAVVARYMHTVYPRCGEQVPADTLRLMTRLADEFGLKPTDGTNPLIRDVGWRTKATDKEKEFWKSSNDPHVRFFAATNPTFSDGTGLLTLVPLTMTDTALSLASALAHAVRTKLRRRAGTSALSR